MKGQLSASSSLPLSSRSLCSLLRLFLFFRLLTFNLTGSQHENKKTECRTRVETIGRLTRAAPAPRAYRPRRLLLSSPAYSSRGKAAAAVFRDLVGSRYLLGPRRRQAGAPQAHRPPGAALARTQQRRSRRGSAPARRNPRRPSSKSGSA